mmetsp:Transcript_78033/g.218727  ORF Transcript_78033/g.218727 Transcript_78033/m.218727 type:complete len:329 (-) Transcript_78033:695-1681(-)
MWADFGVFGAWRLHHMGPLVSGGGDPHHRVDERRHEPGLDGRQRNDQGRGLAVLAAQPRVRREAWHGACGPPRGARGGIDLVSLCWHRRHSTVLVCGRRFGHVYQLRLPRGGADTHHRPGVGVLRGDSRDRLLPSQGVLDRFLHRRHEHPLAVREVIGVAHGLAGARTHPQPQETQPPPGVYGRVRQVEPYRHVVGDLGARLLQARMAQQGGGHVVHGGPRPRDAFLHVRLRERPHACARAHCFGVPSARCRARPRRRRPRARGRHAEGDVEDVVRQFRAIHQHRHRCGLGVYHRVVVDGGPSHLFPDGGVRCLDDVDVGRPRRGHEV